MTDPYRIRDEATWASAREDYLSGLTAEAVCRRYDLGLSAFRRRARQGGWRRTDQDDPAPGVHDLEIYDDLDMDEQVRLARLRFNEALSRGRVMEAVRWRTLWHEIRRARAELDADLFPGMTRAQIQQKLAESDAEEEAALTLASQVHPALPSPEDPSGTPIVHNVHSKKSGVQFVLDAPASEPVDPAHLSRRERRLQAREARRRSG